MTSKFLLIKSFLAIVVASSFNYILVLNDHPITAPILEQVFADSTYQLTGVAVARPGRIFTNYVQAVYVDHQDYLWVVDPAG